MEWTKWNGRLEIATSVLGRVCLAGVTAQLEEARIKRCVSQALDNFS